MKVCLVVDGPTTDPKVVGSSPAAPRLDFVSFTNHTMGTSTGSHRSEHRELLRISSKNLFRNRCKINKLKPKLLCLLNLYDMRINAISTVRPVASLMQMEGYSSYRI